MNYKFTKRNFKCNSKYELNTKFKDYYKDTINAFIEENEIIILDYKDQIIIKKLFNKSFYIEQNNSIIIKEIASNLYILLNIIIKYCININLIYMDKKESNYYSFKNNYYSKILDLSNEKNSKYNVSINDIVTIKNMLDGNIEIYKIVKTHYQNKPIGISHSGLSFGYPYYKKELINDHNINNGEVSDESFVGKSLLGKRKFSIINLKNDDGKLCDYQIIDIN